MSRATFKFTRSKASATFSGPHLEAHLEKWRRHRGENRQDAITFFMGNLEEKRSQAHTALSQ